MSTNTFTPKTSEDPLLKAQVEDNETELVDHSNLIGILQNSVASNATNISSVMNYTTIVGGQLAGTEPSGLKTLIDLNTAKTGITSSQATDIANNKTKLTNIIGSSQAPGPTDNLILGVAGATDRKTRIGYGNQSNRVGFANNSYFENGGVYGFEQDSNGDVYIDGYKI